MPLEELAYLTDLVKCQRAGKRILPEQLTTCPPVILQQELKHLRPRVIISLGNEVGRYFEQLADWPYEKPRVVYLLHPSPANGKSVGQMFEDSWVGFRGELVTRMREALECPSREG